MVSLKKFYMAAIDGIISRHHLTFEVHCRNQCDMALCVAYGGCLCDCSNVTSVDGQCLL